MAEYNALFFCLLLHKISFEGYAFLYQHASFGHL